MQRFPIGPGLLDNIDQRIGELLDGFSALGFGGFSHQGAFYHEGKVHGGGMKPPVDQSLGNVQGRDPCFFLEVPVRCYAFVHATVSPVGDVEPVLYEAEQVVGVQYGHFRHLFHPVGPQFSQIGVCADHYAEVAHKRAHPAHALFKILG